MRDIDRRLQRLEEAFSISPPRATLLLLILASHGNQEALDWLRQVPEDDPLIRLISQAPKARTYAWLARLETH